MGVEGMTPMAAAANAAVQDMRLAVYTKQQFRSNKQ